MNILIVDDHAMIRDGLSMLIKQTFPMVRHIFEAEDCEEAIKIAYRNPLNVVLLDMSFSHGGQEGIEALIKLKQEFNALTVAIFSAHDDKKEWVNEAINKGAMSFLAKNLSRLQLVTELRKILSGAVVLPDSVVNYHQNISVLDSAEINSLFEVTDPKKLGLTSQQFEVLRWLVHGGCGNKVIARKLGIAEQTVKNHLRPIFEHFNVKTRTELIAVVHKKGIVLGSPEVSNSRE